MGSLNSDLQLDNNLKPLKSGEELSSLELSTKGNGARITGDLEVTGNIKPSEHGSYLAHGSTYAGMILGYTSLLNDAADTSYSITASYVTVDADAKITFLAPPSGNVEIFVSVYIASTSPRQAYFGLSDNATYNTVDVTHEHKVWVANAADEETLNHQWVITGLTAGTSYTYWLGAKAAQAGRVSLKWGGDATDEFAPLIMKATALPAETADFVVYG